MLLKDYVTDLELAANVYNKYEGSNRRVELTRHLGRLEANYPEIPDTPEMAEVFNPLKTKHRELIKAIRFELDDKKKDLFARVKAVKFDKSIAPAHPQ